MIAASIDGYGRDQILRVRDFPAPKPGLADILVRVHAASVNPIDFKLRDGKLRVLRPYRFPLTLGHDCAGAMRNAPSVAPNIRPVRDPGEAEAKAR